MKARNKPPAGVSVLQRWITDAERSSGIAVARQQRWVSIMVHVAILETARDENREPLFLLKGGVAMELRLGIAVSNSKWPLRKGRWGECLIDSRPNLWTIWA